MNNFANYSRVIARKLLYPIYNSICVEKLEAPQKVILLLSHMRAGSTLGVNLLCTNPDIIGIGETGIKYTSENDFKILRGKIYSRRMKLWITEKYLLDNLNHNSNIFNYELLSHKQVICIFLVRKSDSTLSSLLNKSFVKLVCPKGIDEMTWACRYYNNRLSALAKYAEFINNKEKALYITYEQLVNDTQTTLNGLKSFFGTQYSFSKEYTPLSSKGLFGLGAVGDTVSKKITSGTIITKPSQKMSLPPEIYQKCLESYQNTNAILLKYCRCIGTN